MGVWYHTFGLEKHRPERNPIPWNSFCKNRNHRALEVSRTSAASEHSIILRYRFSPAHGRMERAGTQALRFCDPRLNGLKHGRVFPGPAERKC